MTKLKPSKGSSLAFIMQTRSSTGPFREKGGGGEPWPAATASIQPENKKKKKNRKKKWKQQKSWSYYLPKSIRAVDLCLNVFFGQSREKRLAKSAALFSSSRYRMEFICLEKKKKKR